MKQDHSLCAWIVIFVVGFGLGALTTISELDMPSVPDWVYTALATVMAAFLGSYFAFRLQREHDERKQKSKKMSAVNRALFELNEAISSLARVKQQALDQYEASPHRALEVQPIIPFDINLANVDLMSISFFLETKHVNVVSNLSGGFASYKESMYVMNERTRLHYEQIQPLVAQAGIRHAGNTTPEILKTAMGDYLYDNLVVMTDLVYVSVNENIDLLEVCFRELRNAAVEVLKSDAFIDINVEN